MIAEIVTILSEEEMLDPGSTGGAELLERRMGALLAEEGMRVLSSRRLSGQGLMLDQLLLESAARFDLVLVLHPVKSDKAMRKALAQVSGRSLVLNEELLKALKACYDEAGRAVPRDVESRALIPKGARWILPAGGLRPGLVVEIAGKYLGALPSEPEAAESLWAQTAGYVKESFRGVPLYSRWRTLQFIGRSPGQIHNALKAHAEGARIAFRRHGSLCAATLAVEGIDPTRLDRELDRMTGGIRRELGADFLCEGAQALHEIVGGLLLEKSRSIAVGESCTGGMVCSLLVDVPGISGVLDRGVVSYSNRSKADLLGVSQDVFKTHGAVSRVTARHMAAGIRAQAGTDIGVAVTGIAGPGGGTREKPVGTVFIGLSTDEGSEVTEYHFRGNRSEIRLQSAQMALDRVRRFLLGR